MVHELILIFFLTIEPLAPMVGELIFNG